MATYFSILAWKNPMDRGAWWAIVHRVAKSRTRLRDHTHTHTHSLCIECQALSWPVIFSQQPSTQRVHSTDGKTEEPRAWVTGYATTWQVMDTSEPTQEPMPRAPRGSRVPQSVLHRKDWSTSLRGKWIQLSTWREQAGLESQSSFSTADASFEILDL